MLAALLATRTFVPPPPPPPITYGNRFVAAIATFPCIDVIRRAAFISTDQTISYNLLLSVSGREALIDQLTRQYDQLINQYSSTVPSYLSTQITGVIATLVSASAILSVTPTTPANAATMVGLRQRLAVSLAVLSSLALPTH